LEKRNHVNYFLIGSSNMFRVSTYAPGRKSIFTNFIIGCLIYLIGGFPTLLYALPMGGTISSGAGTIDTTDSSLTVTQTTNKIVINWESLALVKTSR